MKRDREEYRAVYTRIRHDPEFLPMGKDAKAYFWMLKAELHVSGIGTVMPHTIAGLASMSLPEANAAEKELEERGWIRRDGAVVWIVNGLRYTPNLRPKDVKHRHYIAAHLKTLPASKLVDAFREHYSEWNGEGPSEGATEGPSNGASEGATEGGTDKNKELRKKKTTRATARAPRRGAGWLAPFADPWRERYGGELAVGQARKEFGNLCAKHDRSEVIRRWVIYLDANPGSGQYLNPSKFAQTYGQWAHPPPASGNGTPVASRVAQAEAGAIAAHRALREHQARTRGADDP